MNGSTSYDSGRQSVGIIGAGQLARMTLSAAIALDVPLRLLAERSEDGAARVWPNVSIGAPNDFRAVSELASSCDIVTFDHELVEVAELTRLEASGRCFRPSASTVAVAQDKGRQRERFAAAGLPVPAFKLVENQKDVAEFAGRHGWPVVIKACRGGYDGRGVWVIDSPESAARFLDTMPTPDEGGPALLVEANVTIDKELAVLVARRPSGGKVVYPIVETVQQDGICRELVAPAPVRQSISEAAQAIAENVAEVVDVSGILAVELFLSGGRLLINEIACRPHNSGHFTIEGCHTSQFENHLRAILDWPLGSTAMSAPYAVTVNVIAETQSTSLSGSLAAALSIPDVHVHLYGKAPRPGRKVGHVTALGTELNETRSRATRAASAIVSDGTSGGVAGAMERS